MSAADTQPLNASLQASEHIKVKAADCRNLDWGQESAGTVRAQIRETRLLRIMLRRRLGTPDCRNMMPIPKMPRRVFPCVCRQQTHYSACRQQTMAVRCWRPLLCSSLLSCSARYRPPYIRVSGPWAPVGAARPLAPMQA